MRRRIGALAAVIALVGLASGCSLREVQLWFAINKQQAISRDQARNIADVVNSKKPAGGCDGNYAGSCVPDNATSVHCAGAPGEGPAVRGPLTVTGWDSFELDPDGDRHACDSPVGAFDLFGQVLGDIEIRGWAFDPDTTAPIRLAISVNGYVDFVTAYHSRGDLAAALPGVGSDHGFDVMYGGGAPGDVSAVCVAAINVGTGTNTTLGCKTITTQEVGFDDSSGHDVYGLIEAADVTPGPIRVEGGQVVAGTIHVRGFAFGMPPSAPTFYVGTAPSTHREITSAIVYGRPDVAQVWPGAPAAVGFDLVLPLTVDSLTWGVCVSYRLPPVEAFGLSCRPLDT